MKTTVPGRVLTASLSRHGLARVCGVLALSLVLGGAGCGDKREVAAGSSRWSSAGPQIGKSWTIPELNAELAYLTPGEFSMGREYMYRDERPVTRVRLTRGFWLGRWEVTQGEWTRLMGTNPVARRKERQKNKPIEAVVDDTYPVFYVTWFEAVSFCARLSEKERAAGRLPDGYTYQLPTEAQWEYACRAGSQAEYSVEPKSSAWYIDNSLEMPHPVAQRAANPWGLFDVYGNVWEWCVDSYEGSLHGGTVVDPVLIKPAAPQRVNRGGAFLNQAYDCRSSSRGRNVPNSRWRDVGFRVALAPEITLPADFVRRSEGLDY